MLMVVCLYFMFTCMSFMHCLFGVIRDNDGGGGGDDDDDDDDE